MTKEPWHLDRRVPLALILTILAQTAGAVWFAATLDSRVNVLERDVELQRQVDVQQGQSIGSIEREFSGQAQRVENILRIVERIERRLERMEADRP